MSDFEDALQLDVRKKIYKAIEKNPGIHFREIQRRTDLAVGSLQYHLEYLQKRHIIKTEKQGKFVRYFSVRGKQLGEQTNLMSLLRQESLRHIMLFLLSRKSANNQVIAKNVGLSPSTVSFHLEKLLTENIIGKRRRGRKTYYFVINPEEARTLIMGYRRSFLDDMVDRFTETWEEI
jgi:predicted transcriptional regulator